MTIHSLSCLALRLAISLSVFWLAWPAAAQQTQSQPRPGGRSVCVASAIGQKFAVQTIGVMVFGNALESAAIQSWGLDNLVVQKIGSTLGAGFSVRSAAVPAAAVADLKKPGGLIPTDRTAGFIAALRNSNGGNCHYYVVALPLRGQWPGTNQPVEGVGILKRSGVVTQHFIFAAFWLQLFDGRTGERVRLPIAGSLGEIFSDPYWQKKVDDAWWPVPAQSAAGNSKLKDAARTLVLKVLDKDSPRLRTALTQ